MEVFADDPCGDGTPAELGAVDLATAVVDRQLLRQALEEVPPGQRAVLVLRYFDGLDVAGAAALDPADVKAGDVDHLVSLLRRLERDVQKEK